MGQQYSHLSSEERILIEKLHCEQHLSIRRTAERIGRDKSTVSRELRRGLWFASNENGSYRPYRPKRRTRAMIAKEKGLEPLAALLMLQKIQKPLEEEAQKYISAEKEVHTVEEAIAGAKDILAETVSDEADYRSFIRNLTVKEGKMTSSAKDDSVQSVYEMY